MDLKVGDRVRLSQEGLDAFGDQAGGSEGIVIKNHGPDVSWYNYSVLWIVPGTSYSYNRNHLTKVSMSDSTIVQKMALFFKGEPEKSFIKAGVMKSDETLTEEGKTVFLMWLMKKYGDDFKKEVVDPILAEDKAEK